MLMSGFYFLLESKSSGIDCSGIVPFKIVCEIITEGWIVTSVQWYSA